MSEVGSEADSAARLGAWLLDMGFPRATSRDHLLTMCRGNYHAVWESLLKQVHPRLQVQSRRLQVFVADVNRCRRYDDAVHERIGSVFAPEELEVWRETQALRKQVAKSEAQVAAAKSDLRTLNEIVVEKVEQREQLSYDVQETRRRSGALRAASELLQTRGEGLAEMTHITDRLAPVTAPCSRFDPNEAIEKCVAILSEMPRKRVTDGCHREGGTRSGGQFNSTTLSDVSILSDGERGERESCGAQDKLLDQIEEASVVDLWDALYRKQDQLCAEVTSAIVPLPLAPVSENESSLSVIAESSALHCKLTLLTLDMRRRAAALEKKLVQLMNSAVVEGEDETARELLVLQCEEAGLRGRVNVLHDELNALRQRSGTYEQRRRDVDEGSSDKVLAAILAVDRDLLVRKAETEALLISAELTSVKIMSVVSQLETLLLLRQRGPPARRTILEHETSVQGNYDEFVRHFIPGGPDTSVERRLQCLKEFYTLPSVELPTRLDLSLDFDHSGDTNASTRNVPSLVDELRFFLDKFHLDVNRKLVLRGGESLWISETLNRIRTHALYSATHEVALGAVRAHTLRQLSEQCEGGTRMREALGWTALPNIDVFKIVNSASERMDRMKKKARDSVASLQQTCSHLDVGLDNLKWWEAGRGRQCVSDRRVVCSKSYHHYDTIYTDYFNNKLDG